MHRYAIRAVLALAILTATLAIYVANYGLYPRYFQLGWDEEVRLHDNRTLVVHIIRTFERQGKRLERWRGTYRDTEISFDAGPPLGRIRKKFERYQVNMIEFERGNWYLALSNTSGTPPRRIVDERFPVLILTPDGKERAAASWADVPDFPRQNVMPLTPDAGVAKMFDGTLVTWSEKLAHWKQYPRAANDEGKIIQRHRESPNGDTQ